MIKIDRARYVIKVLGMKEKATELNARKHIKTQLDLTKRALDSMGITQVFRLGKHPEEGSNTVPPATILSIHNNRYGRNFTELSKGRRVGKILYRAHTRNICLNIQQLYPDRNTPKGDKTAKLKAKI